MREGLEFKEASAAGRGSRLRAVAGLALLCLASTLGAQQPGLVPVSPQVRTDKLGNDWYVEANGVVGRQGGGNSLLSQAEILLVGPENFYCNQPMGTPDGRELVLPGSQPLQGLQVTRRVRFLEREGGLLYLDSFYNPGAADVNAGIELRHSFNGTVKAVLADSGRAVRGPLEKGDAGFVVLPGAPNLSAFAFTVCAPGSQLKPRVSMPGTYQVSVFFSVVVPAGKAVSILHVVSQGRLSPRPDAQDLEKLFRPVALARHLRDLPKGAQQQIVNLRGAGAGQFDLASWFPAEYFGVARESSDVLAMGEGTRLRGRASCARLALAHRLGEVLIPWEQVAAMAGGRREGAGRARVFLADGQILRGDLRADEFRFEITGGLRMDLKVADLDVLVVRAAGGAPRWPEGVAAMVETAGGERIALRSIEAIELPMATPWGTRSVRLADLAWFTQSGDEQPGLLTELTDGSRLRAWFGGGSSIWPTTLFGDRSWATDDMRALVCAVKAAAGSGEPVTDEPVRPFVELAGDQRLVAGLPDAVLHFVTAGGPVPLDPHSIRELRNVSEEVPDSGVDDAPWFQVRLWGGGSVLGQLREGVIPLAVGGGVWTVPAREIARLVNPVARIPETTLARIGALIRDLGHDEWRRREQAGAELKSLGELARPALLEALRQSGDAEVRKRVEGILGELE